MKRWRLRITICIILGGFTTIAVAWGFALTPTVFESAVATRGRLPSPIRELWRKHFGDAIPFQPRAVAILNHQDGSTRMVAPSFVAEEAGKRVWMLYGHTEGFSRQLSVLETGWPFKSMSSHWVNSGPHGNLTATSHSQVRLWKHRDAGWWTVPTGIRAAGFLLDTLCYFALWICLLFGVPIMRRSLRAKRGHCPRCGYDLRGQLEAGCPECGWNRTVNRTET